MMSSIHRVDARECMDLVKVCGVRRLASLIAVCMEWDPTPTDESIEELKQQFLNLWERADHIEVIILFLSYIANSKHLDLAPIAGNAEAGGGIQVETPSDDVYDSIMAGVSVKVEVSIYYSIKCIVNSTPAAKKFSLSREDVFMDLLEELGGVSAVAEEILHVPRGTYYNVKDLNLPFNIYGAYGVVDLIPCLITYIAREKGLVQEEKPQPVPRFEYAAGIMRMRDISIGTFESQRVLSRIAAVGQGNPSRYRPPPTPQLVVMCVDLVLLLFIAVWVAGKAFFQHLGDL